MCEGGVLSRRLRYILAGACAILAALCTLAYGQATKHALEVERDAAIKRFGGQTTLVVVASKNLGIGDVVNKTTCEEREWITELVPEGSAVSLDDVSGCALSAPVTKGTPITDACMQSSADVLDVPEGKVGISIAITDKLGLSAAVSPGTALNAYKAADGQVALITREVSVLSGAGSSGSSRASVTLAVPESAIEPFMSAYAGGSLRLVQPGVEMSHGEDGPSEAKKHGVRYRPQAASSALHTIVHYLPEKILTVTRI